MKREERKVYNSLKKTVTKDTIYVEIPLTWTHEARQAIHELLTGMKGMYASCIGPEVISGAECIRYTHSSEYTAQIRQEQESTDIDAVMQSLRRTEYTWNGCKPARKATEQPEQLTAEQTATNEQNAQNSAEKAEEKKEDKTMKEYTGRIIGSRYSTAGESILCNGTSYHVDRTQAGRAWCIEKGMTPAFTIKSNGETFAVWAGTIRSALGVDVEAACAIPA